MTPTLRRARVLAALRELDVAIDFGWRDWSCFCARPYDWMADDLAPGRVVFEVREVTPAHVTVSVFDQGASAGRLSFDAVSWERMRGRAVVGTRAMLDLRSLAPLSPSTRNAAT